MSNSPKFLIDQKFSFQGHMISLDALGSLPVSEKLMLFAKAGVGLVYNKTRLSNDWTFSHYDATTDQFVNWTEHDNFMFDKTRFVPKLGLGAEWSVTDHVAIRLEYERLFDVRKESDNHIPADYNLFNLGVRYLF